MLLIVLKHLFGQCTPLFSLWLIFACGLAASCASHVLYYIWVMVLTLQVPQESVHRSSMYYFHGYPELPNCRVFALPKFWRYSISPNLIDWVESIVLIYFWGMTVSSPQNQNGNRNWHLTRITQCSQTSEFVFLREQMNMMIILTK